MPFADVVLRSEICQGLPADCLARLEQLAQSRSFPPGTVLFTEGAVHTDFHVIVEGHVRLDMVVPGRGRIPILTAGPGDVLAWSALLGDGTMTSTGIALDPVRTVAFPGEPLRQLCESDERLGYHFMRKLAAALSRRLLATRLQLLDLFADHVPVLPEAVVPERPGDPEC
jgi:CRP-like cAMP-binding protein